MYGRVEGSGCAERGGQVQARLFMGLEEGDFRYNDPSRFYVIDQKSLQFLLGYQGLVDIEGRPLDWEQYAAWRASLPRVWMAERGFHNHFIYLDPYTMRDADIEAAMLFHLPNFYKAWTDGWDAISGGMRHGWDVTCRRRPKRYNKLEPETYPQRRLDCLAKVDILKAASFSARTAKMGEVFPSTNIDVGSAATDRASYTQGLQNYTYVDLSNPADGTGSISSVEAWCSIGADDLWAGSFSKSGSTLTCDDSESLGACASGSKQTYSGLDINIILGEYMGAFNKGGDTAGLEMDTSGGSGVWRYNGERIDPTDSATFTEHDSDGMFSLYGTGETAGGGVTSKQAVGAKMVGVGAI